MDPCFRCEWPGSSDKAAVAKVVDARCDWLEARALPSWRGAKDDLMAQCDNPEGDVWVLDDEAAGVIGQTVVQEQGPPFGWTDAERAESALYLSGTITDPAAKALRPGSLIAWWAVDLAARQGVPWVRRHAQFPQVAAYDHRKMSPSLALRNTYLKSMFQSPPPRLTSLDSTGMRRYIPRAKSASRRVCDSGGVFVFGLTKLISSSARANTRRGSSGCAMSVTANA